jgi:hypothetical protein
VGHRPEERDRHGQRIDKSGAAIPSVNEASQTRRLDHGGGRTARGAHQYWEHVTSFMFDGPDLNIPFMMSMAKPPLPRSPWDGVMRGRLFAIYDLGVRGVPERRFGG